jgi:hypothetical protein
LSTFVRGALKGGAVIGTVYGIAPQPPVPEDTRYVDAGPLRIGVEYREVDPEILEATYAHDPEQLAELRDRSPAGGYSDRGVSLHVVAAANGHEYVRFDVFDDDPHYHYNHPGEPIVNNVVQFDTAANGDMLEWALDRLRHHLPAMLTEAGGGEIAATIDVDAMDRALKEVEPMARQARRGGAASPGA